MVILNEYIHKYFIKKTGFHDKFTKGSINENIVLDTKLLNVLTLCYFLHQKLVFASFQNINSDSYFLHNCKISLSTLIKLITTKKFPVGPAYFHIPGFFFFFPTPNLLISITYIFFIICWILSFLFETLLLPSQV